MTTELQTNIVKVRYFITDDETSYQEYSYLTEGRLNVGDIVDVPVKSGHARARVSAIDVPESEIEAFKDKVKTIPFGAILGPNIPTGGLS